MSRYNVVRFYRDASVRRRVLHRGLSLEEAREHCGDPETSSRTATSREAIRRTEHLGAWFDGYEETRR